MTPAGQPAARLPGIGEMIVSARPAEEYRAMFDLREADRAGPVLDCPGGAGDFGAAVRAAGGSATSADPLYALPRETVVATARAGTLRGNRYVAEHRDLYVWSFFASVEDHRDRRLGALERFAADFAADGEHYVAAALPRLPFADRAFALALSGHLLFTYPGHLAYEDHLAGIRELVRVSAGEARIFPLLDTELTVYPRLDALRAELAAGGIGSEIRPVPYEFQHGANRMLACARA
jgi:hypothetical protein